MGFRAVEVDYVCAFPVRMIRLRVVFLAQLCVLDFPLVELVVSPLQNEYDIPSDRGESVELNLRMRTSGVSVSGE